MALSRAWPIRRFLEFFKNLQFRSKLFLSYIFVVIVPLTVLGAYSYSLANSTFLAETKLWMTESVRQATEGLSGRFANYGNMLEYVVTNAQVLRVVNDVDSTTFQKYTDYTQVIDPVFITTRSLNSEIVSLLIYTDNPTISERADSFSRLDRIAGESWYDRIRDGGGPYWRVGEDGIEGYMRFHQRFRNSPISVLAIRIDDDRTFDLEIGSAGEYGIRIHDDQGDLVYAKEPQSEHDCLPPGETLHGRIPPGGPQEIRIGRTRFLAIRQPIGQTGWTFYCYSPMQVHMAAAGNILGATLVLIAACLVLLFFLIWVFSRTLVRRIHNLNEKMRQVEEGNMDLVVTSATRDEIGQLTNRFGNMMRRINALIEEIYKSRLVQKDAEMKALQAQINPHYLYNTLSLINWKAIEIDAMEISRITRSISTYYRTVLNNGQDVITVEDELTNTRCYLDIQLQMHNNSFQVRYDIDPSILGFSMIKIILQPIVENAIVHGLEQRRDTGGEIVVTGKMDGDHILLSVRDNGPGMEQDKTRAILGVESAGYGLKNVNERLRLFFGPTCGLSIRSAPGAGTEVVVCIPKWTGTGRPEGT